MAQPPSHTTFPAVRKPVPRKLLVDRGTGTDYQTRLATIDGLLTPNDRFYIRSHSPTPDIDVNSCGCPRFGSGPATTTAAPSPTPGRGTTRAAPTTPSSPTRSPSADHP